MIHPVLNKSLDYNEFYAQNYGICLASSVNSKKSEIGVSCLGLMKSKYKNLRLC